MDGDRLFYTLLGGIGLITVCGIAMKGGPGPTPAVAAVASSAPATRPMTAREMYGQVFPDDFPVVIAHEMVAVAKTDPRRMDLPEVITVMSDWQNRSPSEVCTARYNGFVQVLTAWPKWSEQQRAQGAAAIANAAYISGDCATILSRG